ncbi:MAG: right-handed parallel beta-helix repeat-containing protein [Methanospirillaceae archaeon]|nr:right-handed parallel beta-helix repeat-containing protein [Methanospirillaceae archaeon]
MAYNGVIRIILVIAFLCFVGVMISSAGENSIPIEEPYHSWLSSISDYDGSKGTMPEDSSIDSVRTVCSSGCDYTTIQAAVNDAEYEDQILVYEGYYPESLVINKSITIAGENHTVLVGIPGEEHAVQTTADRIILTNLSFTPVSGSAVRIGGNLTALLNLNLTAQDPDNYLDPVITSDDHNGIFVSGCQIDTTGKTGIWVCNTSGLFVQDNTINTGRDSEYLCTGIDILHATLSYPARFIWINNNTFSHGGISVRAQHKQGGKIIYPEMDQITITDNTIQGSSFWGIDIGGWEDTHTFARHLHHATVSDNLITNAQSGYANLRVNGISQGVITGNVITDFKNNGRGAVFDNLDNVLIADNMVQDGIGNWMYGFCGMEISDIQDSVIRNNTLSRITPYGYHYAPATNMTPNLIFDETNTADGLPVIYRESVSDQSIETQELAMVVLMSCSNTTISRSVIRNTGLGIGIYNCTNTVVTNNQVTDANIGMMLIQSSESRVAKNTFEGGWDCMGVGDNRETEIRENQFSGYHDSGMVFHLEYADGITVTNNTFTGDFTGKEQAISIIKAIGDSVLLTKNTIRNNTRAFLITQSANFIINDNIIEGCGIGMNLLGAQNNRFHNNRIYNDDEYSEGFYVISSDQMGGGTSQNNEIINNYIMSARPVNVSTVDHFIGPDIDIKPGQWGFHILASLPVPSQEEDTYPNTWNTTRTAGQNIVNGPYIGGNYYATPDGTGWSQTHPDRGDGFVAEPYVFNDKNIDYLPLHLPVTPTPTPQTVHAEFSAEPVSGNPPLTVAFTDQSTGSPKEWEWNFGDGYGSTLQNPNHTYTGMGIYSVTLTASKDGTGDSIRKPSLIGVTAQKPKGFGLLIVSSDPPGANTYLDGIQKGITPLIIEKLEIKPYTVTLKKDGYKDYTGTINVRSITPTVLSPTLVPV